MRVDLFDFDLPEARIALRPARPREAARLLHVPPAGMFEDLVVRDAPRLFRPGDVLVFNDTKVIPAALSAVRPARDPKGALARFSLNLHRRVAPDAWRVFVKGARRLSVGDGLFFDEGLFARVLEKGEEGDMLLRFDRGGPELDAAIASAGRMPLPPYIAGKRAIDEADAEDYQTMFAAAPGAVAAPTAGLHFTPGLMERLAAAGVMAARVTLHVGAGTFLPVKADDTEAHRMHAEWFDLPAETADTLNRARAEGGRVIAIGTTALRTLESAADPEGRVRAMRGETDIFIRPGYRFKIVDGLWTNFHLPRSTLFMLVSAFAGLERMRAAYAHAIAEEYRFYSYGDATLLWRADP